MKTKMSTVRHLLLFAFLAGCPTVWAASSITFTADNSGTFPRTFQIDGHGGRLTVDLAAIPADARVFRAELVLVPITSYMQQRPLAPTRVYPEGQQHKALKFVPPRFVSLDALDAAQTAVKSGKPLALKVQTTCQGVARLEVSCADVKIRTRQTQTVSNLKVLHRAGQSLLVFTEPALEPIPPFNTGGEVRAFVKKFGEKHPGVAFRIWRASERITPQSIAAAELVGECGFFTAWNSGYHQDETDRKPPLRYRVVDGGEEVPWGTGIYAHNPARPGQAFYAVTVAVAGEEDFSQLNPGNTTAEPIQETVGLGVPILQWKETPSEWHYRKAAEGGHLNRLIYTRWESWPNASRPSVPIDYLVATATEPLPSEGVREPQSHALRIEPAPVGLHLHCWGGSLNGGYGWWHNAHRGTVLIAANQIPYDWWTGYHEALGTCKTWGDGHVHPFTMNRLFAFLDWASTQWKDAPDKVRKDWPKLDLSRVFAAGTSMGGSGAPMCAVRYGERIAWALGWVGVHMPEFSPQFKSSYQQMYGPRNLAITMPDGQTSPWDYFNDVAYLRQHPAQETGFIIASNGKNDGAIGWPQAAQFARALQDTRRPHMFNWALSGHGTRTLVGANFDQDIRIDQTLPAFTHCSLDDDLGTGTPRSNEAIKADRQRQTEEVKAGKRREVNVDPYDGASQGAYNAWLSWETEDIVDQPAVWEMTVRLSPQAPQDSCTVDLTPRRCQRFKPQPGAEFTWINTSVNEGKVIQSYTVVADQWGLLTLENVAVAKGKNRIRIAR
jgi:hypothetical protein